VTPTDIQKKCIPHALVHHTCRLNRQREKSHLRSTILQKLWDNPQGLFVSEPLGATMIIGGSENQVNQAIALAKLQLLEG
jgi:hypothetical protein